MEFPILMPGLSVLRKSIISNGYFIELIMSGRKLTCARVAVNLVADFESRHSE